MKRSLLYLFMIVGLPFASVAQEDNAAQNALNNEELAPRVEVGVKPNPASDFISIDISGVENAQVRIVDVLGNVIWNATIDKTQSINVSEYRNGIYFVNVHANGVNISKKVIVRH